MYIKVVINLKNLPSSSLFIWFLIFILSHKSQIDVLQEGAGVSGNVKMTLQRTKLIHKSSLTPGGDS